MKRRNFTLSVSKDIYEVIKQVEQCPLYAWIIHDKDINPETNQLIEKHVHAYIEFPNPRSFDSVAELIGIPPNMLLKVIDKNGILQYLIHKNQPDKFQYDFKDIQSNFDLEPFFSMDKSPQLWDDFNKLRSHKISPNEFYELHKAEINRNAFYQRLKIFQLISDYQSVDPPTPKPPIHTLLK